jgi:hypothetical protein
MPAPMIATLRARCLDMVSPLPMYGTVRRTRADIDEFAG